MKKLIYTLGLWSVCGLIAYAQEFKLNINSGYFQNQGVDIMAFDDIYPEGHQSGVSIIMHGNRIATCGDIRFEPTPGQWQPVPKQRERKMDEAANTITTWLSFPDSSRHQTGFNPMIYPDFVFNYKVTVRGEGASVIVTVDLDRPIPDEFIGKLGFNLELFPGALFGKPWIMDDKQGIFPQQPNAPVLVQPLNCAHTGNFNPGGKADLERLSGYHRGYNPILADDIIAEPYAVGRRFVVRPDDPANRFVIESKGTELKLYDGRMNHNNGWFVVRSDIAPGKTTEAIKWVITPNVIGDWRYKPVVQTSQIGYHPEQPKVAIIEMDKRESNREIPILYKITETGEQKVFSDAGVEWGQFLRYNYLKFDFSHIKEEGLYQVHYGPSVSSVFRIARDVYDRGVWQPVLEYFLPVQMCHVRVNEKYRVWHDFCHLDDARMAPVNFNHIDGYVQGPSTLTKFNPGDVVPGLNRGGWHDAGDFDLRIESQTGECYVLALTYEAFDVNYDATAIDQAKRIVEIHEPDGKNDILQQIEHGLLSVVEAYRSLGRLYRGIICNNLRQYVLLGDAAAMTDGIKGNDDDRWVFTENNPSRELAAAAGLAASARAMKNYNDTLYRQTLEAAETIFKVSGATTLQTPPNKDDNETALQTPPNERAKSAKIQAAVELYLATGKKEYKDFLLSETEYIVANIDRIGWFIGRAEQKMNDAKFTKAIKSALPKYRKELEKLSAETPYGIPYRPHIWGAGWDIQRLGYQYYFLHKSYPEIFEPNMVFNTLNFILGSHPGSNTASFASGVGAESAIPGYGLNRADWSYIPGGVVSGTALIRPDFPELLEFPYLWQQVEYVMGGGSSHYMFLVLAAQQILMVAQLKQEIVQDLTENILPFWANHSPDPSGGFYGTLNFDGTPQADAMKGGILNARLVWTFSSAYRILEDEQYLTLANRAQRYFLDHFIDPEYGGSFYSVNANGEPLNMRKETYQNAYAIYSLSEHHRATGNKESLDAAIAVYQKLIEHAYDSINGGFIESFTREWQMVDVEYPKTMNTNLHILEALTNLYRVWNDAGLKKHLQEQIDVMSHKVLNQETWHEQLFFTMDWQNQKDIDSYGHDIEFSWLLVEAAEVLGDEEILKDAQRIAVNLVAVQLEQGLNKKGAMMYEKSGDHLNANLEWWPQTETVIGCLNAWQISGDKKYLDAAVRTWEWIKTNMIDREYGEWYSNVYPDGTPQKTRVKADLWRCPYHNSRMGFEVLTRFP